MTISPPDRVVTVPICSRLDIGMALELPRYLLRLLPNLRPPLLRRLHNRRSASSRQNALPHADDFALRRAAQCFAAARTPFN
jgi:hypothetical protein